MEIIDQIVYKGDTIDLEFQLYKDKSKNEYWDLTNYQIRFELHNNVKVKKATANVTGGSDNQIIVTDFLHGNFLVTINSEESSTLIPGDYNIEIQITSPQGKVYTVFSGGLRILPELIDWTSI